jgi:nitrate reductase NapE component
LFIVIFAQMKKPYKLSVESGLFSQFGLNKMSLNFIGQFRQIVWFFQQRFEPGSNQKSQLNQDSTVTKILKQNFH